MTTVLLCVLCYWLGLRTPFFCAVASAIYYHRKSGTCFRYQWGPRETRDGTNSNFCLRCGQPAGYHTSWEDLWD